MREIVFHVWVYDTCISTTCMVWWPCRSHRRIIMWNRKSRTHKVKPSLNGNERWLKFPWWCYLLFSVAMVLRRCLYMLCLYMMSFCESCSCTALHWFRDLQFLFVIMNSSVNFFCYTRWGREGREVAISGGWFSYFWTPRTAFRACSERDFESSVKYLNGICLHGQKLRTWILSMCELWQKNGGFVIYKSLGVAWFF
jgi:hypothetical protein